MAKKARKKSAKKKSAKTAKKLVRRKKSRTVTKKKKRRVSKRKSFTGKVSGAYRTVVDTVKGTDRLRNKMELPGTSESE